MEGIQKFKRVSTGRAQEQAQSNAAQGISEQSDSYLKTIMKRFWRDRIAVISLVIFVLLVLIAVFAPLLAPHNPAKTIGDFEAAPNAQYWLGTDEVGRDVLSRLIYGTRVSLTVGVLSVLLYSVIGTSLGLISGFLGGIWDTMIMRLTEVFMSFPYFMVILVIVSLVGPSIWTVTIVIGLLGWPPLCRLVRGEVMKLKKADYILAAVSSGYHQYAIMFKQILPNVLSLILVNMTFGIATSIITEASLSFLGVGVQPPTASWGNMMSNAQSLSVLADEWWRWLPAGIMVLIAVLSINFFGDGLRRAIEGQIK